MVAVDAGLGLTDCRVRMIMSRNPLRPGSPAWIEHDRLVRSDSHPGQRGRCENPHEHVLVIGYSRLPDARRSGVRDFHSPGPIILLVPTRAGAPWRFVLGVFELSRLVGESVR